LQVPVSHRHIVLSTNLLGRFFRETRRRSKVALPANCERPPPKMLRAAANRAPDS